RSNPAGFYQLGHRTGVLTPGFAQRCRIGHHTALAELKLAGLRDGGVGVGRGLEPLELLTTKRQPRPTADRSPDGAQTGAPADLPGPPRTSSPGRRRASGGRTSWTP